MNRHDRLPAPAKPRKSAGETEEANAMVSGGAKQEGRLPGRYHAEQVRVSLEAEAQEQLQDLLSGAEEKEWRLVGVAGGLPEGGMILFWDTKRSSFGRTSRH